MDMEPTRPFFERALYLNPTKHCFAYATFVGHGRLIRGRDRVAIDHGPGAAAAVDEDGFREGSPTVNHEYVDFVHVPNGMQIYKKNVSICGFMSPSAVRIEQTPDHYLLDLMKHGIEKCYPSKRDMFHFFKYHDDPSLIQHFGMKDLLQVEQETCNVLSNKGIFLNKAYTIAGIVDAEHPAEFEVNGFYKFNLLFISRKDEPTAETTSFVSPEGNHIHYTKYGPFNLFDTADINRLMDDLFIKYEYHKKKLSEEMDVLDAVEDLTREHERKLRILRDVELDLRKLTFGLPDKEKIITTKYVFNIFKCLEVDIAYILDTSCSTVDDSTSGKRLILPEGVGYGRKRKSKRIKQYKKRKTKKRKTKKRKSYLK